MGLKPTTTSMEIKKLIDHNTNRIKVNGFYLQNNSQISNYYQ